MLFNSLTFALFLPLVFALYLALPLRGRQIMLLGASYLFYCWETAAYGFLLLASTVIDFHCGLLMNRRPSRRWRRGVLLVSLAANLGMLGFFKYGDFLAQNVVGLGNLLGFEGAWTPMGFILPVGISFYTFQTMSYTIELYRGKISPCRDPVAFALFVSFFPQLVAGPIERADRLLPQLQVFHRVRWDDISAGLTRIVIGLFRKLVLADRFAIMVDRCYTHLDELNTLTVWVGVFAFGMQIYFDFCGYADIAIGAARLFGIRLSENFRRPVIARNIADFWNRWHMTLTSWLRDYVFQPLGGARKGGLRTAFNGVLVLLLCGLWHGAAWTFIFWGAFHAVHMMLYFAWRYRRRAKGRRGRAQPSLAVLPFMVLGMMTLNNISAVFFRSPSLPVAGRVLRALAGFGAGAGGPTEWYVIVYAGLIGTCTLYDFAAEYLGGYERMLRLPWGLRAAGVIGLAILTVLFATDLSQPYIYFQF